MNACELELAGILYAITMPTVQYFLSQCQHSLIIETDSATIYAWLSSIQSKDKKLMRWLPKLYALNLPLKFRH